jgi:hypothetical protein
MTDCDHTFQPTSCIFVHLVASEFSLVNKIAQKPPCRNSTLSECNRAD